MSTKSSAKQVSESRRLRGRPIEHRLGDALATLNVLTEPTAVTSAQELSSLLNIPEASAAAILDSFSESTETYDALLPSSITENSGERARLGTPGPLAHKTLRLTTSQADACEEALDVLGISDTDPLREKLHASFYPSDYAAVIRSSEVDTENSPSEAFRVWAAALAQAERIDSEVPSVKVPVVEFLYEGTNDSELGARTRRVVPTALYYSNQNVWVVEGYDIDARAKRTFVAQKVQTPKLTSERKEIPAVSPSNPDEEIIEFSVTKDVAQQVLTWNSAQLVSTKSDCCVIEIPYYRDEWLPRHILSLGNKVSYDNPRMHSEVRRLASRSLKKARALGVIE